MAKQKRMKQEDVHEATERLEDAIAEATKDLPAVMPSPMSEAVIAASMKLDQLLDAAPREVLEQMVADTLMDLAMDDRSAAVGMLQDFLWGDDKPVTKRDIGSLKREVKSLYLDV